MEGSSSAPRKRNTAKTDSPSSCERCKRRKIKCNRQYPICAKCAEARVSCEYSGKKKPGFSAGLRQSLEATISKLEMDLQALRGSTLSAGAESRMLKPTDAVAAGETEDPPQHELPSSSSRDSPFAATATRTNLIRAQQPPANLVVSLASLYFRHIHPWFPFLNVHSVWAEMATTDDPTLLYLALFGAALPFSYDSRLDKRSSDAFWKYSKRRIMLEAMEEPSYSSLEALTILVLDISGMTHGPQVWGPMALAIKHAVHLKSVRGHVLRTSAAGTDCEPPSDDKSIYRGRLFWAIYALDCYVTMTTAQRSQLTDDHVQHFLGTRDSVWEARAMDTNTVFRYQLHLCDLSRLVQRVYLKYTELQDHSEEALAWFAQFQSVAARLGDWTARILPASIRFPPSPSAMARDVSSLIMLHLFIHGLTIHLHGLMAYPALDSMTSPAYESARSESQTHCLLSIDSMTRILVQLADQRTEKLGWPAAWSAWVAARYLIVEASYGLELKNDLYHVLAQFIDKMSAHWQVVGKYRRLQQRAVAELATTDPPPHLQRGPGKGASVLAPMRDFRVPASDLEDRFRADPMLFAEAFGGTERSPGLTMPAGGFEGDNLSAMSVAQDRMYEAGYALPVAGPPCDQWYAMPLFGSSAYQPHLFMAPSDSSSSAYNMCQ
ncbi:hypothetical protein BJX63DRAFT_438498 [Aspergillus granulosus]|uniref:Zn(2)-C6 fungal-type domain-containing protein n=1 Tax=Aspergillus granulosus TaxID=176169 RepID=A0ABR4GRT9_9EURO